MMHVSLCCFLCLGLFGQHPEKEENMDIDSSNPEAIDPYQEDVGNFLDVDLTSYEKKAGEAYQTGNYEEAARYYLMVLRYDIHDVNSIYNLACCYGLLGKDTLAARYLARAAKAGYDDIALLRNDSDFEKVRGKKVFDATVDSLAAEIENKKKALGDVIYIDNTAFFKCRVQLPENYDSGKQYPCVIGLHGGGESSENFITLWKDFKQLEFIYAAPQAPYAWLTDRMIGYDWALWPTGDLHMMERAKEKLNEYIAKIVRDLGKRYNIGETYLMGFSQGSIYTYTAGITNHHLFKGLIVLSGVGIYESMLSRWIGMVDIEWPSEESFKAAKDLKIFIAHSKDDKVVPYELGTKSKDVLLNYGYDVTFYDFEGGHTVAPDVLEKIEKWMKE